MELPCPKDRENPIKSGLKKIQEWRKRGPYGSAVERNGMALNTHEKVIKAVDVYDGSKLCVKETEDKGRDLVAVSSFEKGEFVTLYSGERVSAEEVDQREARYQVNSIGCYMFHHPQGIIDASLGNEFGRLMNHVTAGATCQPHTRIVQLKSGEYAVPFLAKRNIVPGESLTWDYGARDEGISWLNKTKGLVFFWGKDLNSCHPKKL
jgi:hypothetical protein